MTDWLWPNGTVYWRNITHYLISILLTKAMQTVYCAIRKLLAMAILIITAGKEDLKMNMKLKIVINREK